MKKFEKKKKRYLSDTQPLILIWRYCKVNSFDWDNTVVELQFTVFIQINYSWLSFTRTGLFQITTYLEVKILSLPKHENLTTSKKYCGKEEKLLLGAISPLFHNIFDISLTSKVQLHIYLLNVVVWIIFSSIWKSDMLKYRYLEVFQSVPWNSR